MAKVKKPKIKRLYNGVFNYSCKVEILYAFAYTKRQAWAIMCRRLADKHEVGVLTVMQMFDGKKDNYEIEEVT